MTAASKPRLSYFPAAGRVLGLRIAMHAAFGKEGWEDVKISFDEWKTGGFKQSTALGYLPLLELPSTNGAVMTLTQTTAIARWAAKQSGLYPADMFDALLVDEAMDVCTEALDKCPGRGLSAEEKQKQRQEYAESGLLHKVLALLQERIGNKNYLTGDALTIGDLFVYMLTDMIVSGDFDCVDKELIDKDFPGLAAHHDRVKQHPTVQDYYAKYDTENHYFKE